MMWTSCPFAVSSTKTTKHIENDTCFQYLTLTDMTFTNNIKYFSNGLRSDLVESYLLLISIELALKDAKYMGKGGHDIPGMLEHASESEKAAAKQGVQVQLLGLATKLSNSLKAITCQSENGHPQAVPHRSYPFLRYCRCEGDWNGAAETSALRLVELLDTCKNTRSVLKSVGKTIGVNI